MKKFFITIVLLLIFLIATSSNPSKADYASFVKDEISDETAGILGVINGPVIETFTTKKNYGVFSLFETKMEDDKEKMLAIGLFNNFIWIHAPKSSSEK